MNVCITCACGCMSACMNVCMCHECVHARVCTRHMIPRYICHIRDLRRIRR